MAPACRVPGVIVTEGALQLTAKGPTQNTALERWTARTLIPVHIP